MSDQPGQRAAIATQSFTEELNVGECGLNSTVGNPEILQSIMW